MGNGSSTGHMAWWIENSETADVALVDGLFTKNMFGMNSKNKCRIQTKG